VKHLMEVLDTLFDRLGSWTNRLIPIGTVVLMLLCIPYAVKQMRPARQTPSVIFWPDSASDKISLSTDTLFEFGKSKLTGEGVAKIRDIAHDIGTSAKNGLIVVGHADHFGDAGENQRLSTARAREVRNELVKTIDPALVSYIGVGNRSPLTKNGECPGTEPTPEMIGCNAKDRRVEIWLRPQ
jgi:OmpA-OmpF porin, OOP family